jgi:D-amino-acid oxidase
VQVTVVGAGIVGLTTALVLQDIGHDVRVIAADTGDATTSAVAAAVWFPYRCGPRDKVIAWADVTRRWLEGIRDEVAGVDRLTGYEISDDDDPWWAAGLDVTRVPAPVAGAPFAWRYSPMRVEPALFLPWLKSRLRAIIEPRRVTSLDDVPGDIVVNCTGLASRELANDDSVTPLFGQIVICEPGNVDRRVTITDDRDPDAMLYLIPRRGEIVLGGCALPHGRLDEDPAITARILDHARALALPIGPVTRVRTGLRPFRETVRVERVGRIVHNYGHGGAGYTLCRGTAEEVSRLVEA